jgi:hypothetical protein
LLLSLDKRLLQNRETLLRLWICLLWAGAFAMLAGLLGAGYGLGNPAAVIVLTIVAVGAEHESIGLTPHLEVSVASLVCVFAAVVFGPVAAT